MLAGSSPLARGLPDRAFICAMHARIIPARAGFTRHRGVDQRLVRDHPRSRGVYIGWGSDFASTMGSSPLARGLPPAAPRGGQRQRIIPARAGFTNRSTGAPITTRDHPRSRGVYGVTEVRPAPARGSSPLARGLHSRAAGAPAGYRIIPARAGFTRGPEGGGAPGEDHPRSRGVYPLCSRTPGPTAGSSPLARGLRGPIHSYSYSLGIIPARAGFTPLQSRPLTSRQDHPRSRGVYHGVDPRHPLVTGSSPLARGLHGAQHKTHPCIWIIPARAGFTWDGFSLLSILPDHPRSRGVYDLGGCGCGSQLWIIPARAGFT